MSKLVKEIGLLWAIDFLEQRDNIFFGIPVIHSSPTGENPIRRFKISIKVNDGWGNYTRSVSQYHECCHLVQDLFTPFGAWHDMTRRFLDLKLLNAYKIKKEINIAQADCLKLIDSFKHRYTIINRNRWSKINLKAILEGDAAHSTYQEGFKNILAQNWTDSEIEPYVNFIRFDKLPLIYNHLAFTTATGLDIEPDDLLDPNTKTHIIDDTTYWNDDDLLRRFACNLAFNSLTPDDLNSENGLFNVVETFCLAITTINSDIGDLFIESIIKRDESAEKKFLDRLNSFCGLKLYPKKIVFEKWIQYLTEKMDDPLSKYRADALKYRLRNPFQYLLNRPFFLVLNANLPILVETREGDIITLCNNDSWDDLDKIVKRRLAEMCLVDSLIGAYKANCPHYPGCECPEKLSTPFGFPSESCNCLQIAKEFNIQWSQAEPKSSDKPKTKEVTMVKVKVDEALKASKEALQNEKGAGFDFPGLIELLVVNVVLSIGVNLITIGITDWIEEDEKPVTQEELTKALTEMKLELLKLQNISDEQIEKARAKTIEHLKREGYSPQASVRIFETVKSALVE